MELLLFLWGSIQGNFAVRDGMVHVWKHLIGGCVFVLSLNERALF